MFKLQNLAKSGHTDGSCQRWNAQFTSLVDIILENRPVAAVINGITDGPLMMDITLGDSWMWNSASSSKPSAVSVVSEIHASACCHFITTIFLPTESK